MWNISNQLSFHSLFLFLLTTSFFSFQIFRLKWLTRYLIFLQREDLALIFTKETKCFKRKRFLSFPALFKTGTTSVGLIFKTETCHILLLHVTLSLPVSFFFFLPSLSLVCFLCLFSLCVRMGFSGSLKFCFAFGFEMKFYFPKKEEKQYLWTLTVFRACDFTGSVILVHELMKPIEIWFSSCVWQVQMTRSIMQCMLLWGLLYLCGVFLVLKSNFVLLKNTYGPFRVCNQFILVHLNLILCVTSSNKDWILPKYFASASFSSYSFFPCVFYYYSQYGVILGADTRATRGPIVLDKNAEKIHYLASNIYCCGSGMFADTEVVTSIMTVDRL